MKRRHVPWWLYVVAASFCGYFALIVYVDFWGPWRVGIETEYRDGRMVLRYVLPNSVGARAGLRADDCVGSVEGRPIQGSRDWVQVASNFEAGKPRRFEIERANKNLEVVVTLGRRPLQWPDPASLTLYAGRIICLLLAFVVAFSRSHDSVALLGSWLLAAISTLGEPFYGFAVSWRHLPAPMGILLWIAFASGLLVAVIFFTFFAVFPRKLFRSRWPLTVAWTLGLAAVLPDFLGVYLQVYAPEHVTQMWEKVFSVPFPSWLVFLAAGLIALAVNYRRLEDLNEKRRIRVLVVGTSVGCLGYIPFPLFLYFIPRRFGNIFFSTPAPIVCAFLFLFMPLSFTYALLRHRLFDIRVILRQGLQYALARRVVLAAVPMLAALLLLDLWLHADQPLAAILRSRGWVYAGLAGLALLAHMQRCPECGTCYDTGITRCALDSAALVPVTLPRMLEGRYRVDRRLGRGGMGTVYEAADTALGRRVAVKVIRDDLVGSAEAAERFRREARATATFAHSNVVTVYDFGLAVDRRPFLVMELLYGDTLRARLRKETRLTAPRTVAILRGVCAAIEAAHRRQLIHRDLKPENIFLACSDSQEIAKVLDFGLAKFILSTKEEVTVDSATGMLIGTWRYMSPEQLRGEAASPAWDLWALAVVAYEMLTGAHPFAVASGFELERAIAAGEAIPLAAHLPAAPPSWQEFFDRTLACESTRRPDSPGSFLSQLESTLR